MEFVIGMDAQKQVEFINGELAKHLNDMWKRGRRDKRKAVILRMASVVLAGLITVLLGLAVRSQWGSWASNIALMFGAIITVLNAFDAYFDHRSLWVQRTVTAIRLEDLKRELTYYLAGRAPGEIDSEQLDRYAARLNEILDADLKDWLTLRAQTTVPTPPSTSAPS